MNDVEESFPLVSIIIVNTNELHHLKNCLPSVINQTYPNLEVIIVDNCSIDQSVEYIGKHFPSFKIIKNHSNMGYAGANNIGFCAANGDYIFVINPDTILDKNCVMELFQSFDEKHHIGLATPKILLMNNPERINACGNDITFTGLTFCRGLNLSSENYSQLEYVSAVSGAAFMIYKPVLKQIGGFDENYFIYYEDTDLSLRALLAGYKIIYVPTALIKHDYSFRFSAKKCFYQERNRIYTLLKIFHPPTYFFLLPGFIIAEMLAWGYAFLKGYQHLYSKLCSYCWIILHGKTILESRKKTQKLRRVSDAEILSNFSSKLWFAQTTTPLLGQILEKIFNPIVSFTAWLVRLSVRW